MMGENDTYICDLIRNDNIDEFISYVNKNDIQLTSKIEPSIFETNSLLYNDTSLIQYSAFFGSIQIFKYLYLNDVIIDESVWIYSIHGNHPEIIDICQKTFINMSKEVSSVGSFDFFDECINESIKCHHNEITNYLILNENNHSGPINFLVVCKNYNYNLLSAEFINKSNFFNFCKYDYYSIVELFIKCSNINVNDINDSVSPLCIAIKKQNFEIVQLLLNVENIDVNLSSSLYCGENTPLYVAILSENSEIIQLLLNHKGIDVNMKSYFYETCDDDREVTPLLAAIRTKNVEIVKLLLECEKIDVNLKCNETYSHLDGAIESENIEIIELILEKIKITDNIREKNKTNIQKILSNIGYSGDYSFIKPEILKFILNYLIVGNRELKL